MQRIHALTGLILASALLLPAPGAAQDRPDPPAGEVQEVLLDRVAAVVGDSIILLSEVQDFMFRSLPPGSELPEDQDERRAFEQEALSGLVDRLLMLQAAASDSLIVAAVSQDRVDDTFRQAWQDQISTFGSEAGLRTAVEAEGMTLPQYRASLRDDIYRELLLRNYLEARQFEARTIIVSDDEVRRVFEEDRGTFGQRPAELSFRMLFIEPTASEEARAAARTRAEEVLQMIRGGEDFAEMARRLSDDEGSRMQGGDLGWHRRPSDLVPEFEEAAFALREGQVSEVVETSFGAHIIKVERTRAGERRLRHILIGAERSPDDEGIAQTRAAEIAAAVREGTPLRTFRAESAQLGYPDSLTIPRAQVDQLPSEMAAELRTASQGDVLGPITFPVGEGLTLFVIVDVTNIREAGEYTFDDVREQLRGILRQERFRDRLLGQLRARTYVDIRL
jgi:peptidyl-prolyl cis-trans isomerase SurA